MNKVYVDHNCSICSTYGDWISKHDNELVIESQEMLSKQEYELDTLVFKTDSKLVLSSSPGLSCINLVTFKFFVKIIDLINLFPIKLFS